MSKNITWPQVDVVAFVIVKVTANFTLRMVRDTG
jgi:hypothetical protein